MAEADAQLVSLYLARGLLDAAQTPVHLPTECPTSHKAAAMRQNILSGGTRVLTDPVVEPDSGKWTLRPERGELSGDPVELIVVPHPAAPGGNSPKLVTAFRDVVGQGV